ncbi:MAG TPA: hypothetical protein VGL94_23380 [Ktedonobacteraceae bacterium]|jgi:hypothetical protein
MKVLWVSDSPTGATGYGNATRFVCAGPAERGHRVSILDGGSRSDQPIPWHNCMLYPMKSGTNELLSYLHHLQLIYVAVTSVNALQLVYFNYQIIEHFMQTVGVPH